MEGRFENGGLLKATRNYRLCGLSSLLLLSVSGCFTPQTSVQSLTASLTSTDPIATSSPLPPSIPGKFTAAWVASHAKGVNTAGGGYKVYYSLSPALDNSTPFVNVPYVSGAQAPTSVSVTSLVPGKYYLNVVSYSAANAIGSTPTALTVTVQ